MNVNMKYLIFVANILFFAVSAIKPIGEQERDCLYAMHELNRDFNSCPEIKDNLDELMAMMHADLDLTESQLAKAKRKLNITRLKSFGWLSGLFITRIMPRTIVPLVLRYSKATTHFINCWELGFLMPSILKLSSCGAALYDNTKNRDALSERVAADKAILAKLVELQNPMKNMGANSGTICAWKVPASNDSIKQIA